MKKALYRHILFWIAYSIQGTLFQYAWLHNMYPNHAYKEVWYSVLCNFYLLVPKMLFVYFLLYVIGQAFKKTKSSLSVVVEITIAFILTIFIHRLINNYCVNGLLYPGSPNAFSTVFNQPRLFFALLDIGFVAGAAVAIKLFRLQISYLRKQRDLTKEKLETELKFLKNQINPHFLFNTLNNIYGLARKKSDKTPEVVLKLSKLLRFILYESAKEFIIIADEIRILEDYIQLERIRYNDRLQINFTTNIDNCNHPITPLILLPFVENAFKHGVNETVDSSGIDIDITLQMGKLVFIVKNSQDSNHEKELTEKIGLSNIRRQLQLMYKDYSLEIENLEKSFNVNLQIDLNSHATI